VWMIFWLRLSGQGLLHRALPCVDV